MKEYDKYDNSNPFLWLLIFIFFLFFFTQWAGSRPTKLKPLSEKRPAATSHYRGR
jgi:hypothetical protein